MDNASGLATALSVARALAPKAGRACRGLRLALFNSEEWALAGSRAWLNALPATERERMVLNVNLDAVGGARGLTALCSGFPMLASWVRRIADREDEDLTTFLPLMSNSDHANFAAAGIAALRLVAGFDECKSNIRYVLTPADTREKVEFAELKGATRIAAAITWAGMTGERVEMRNLKRLS
jgi:aminopeptidase YwaD